MGKVLTYSLEGNPSRVFMSIRVKGLEKHMVFDGDSKEGEFCQRYPNTRMELRGLYSIDDSMLSIFVTDMPEDHTIQVVDDLFEGLVRRTMDERPSERI